MLEIVANKKDFNKFYSLHQLEDGLSRTIAYIKENF